MMVEFVGSSSSNGCNGPVLVDETMIDEFLDVAYIILRSHSKGGGQNTSTIWVLEYEADNN
jgi:hypothetical protein